MVAGTAGATGLTGLPGCTFLNGGDRGDGGSGIATIAVTAPKSGQLSSFGKSVEQGYQLGVQMNEALDQNVEIVLQDDESDPEKAPQVRATIHRPVHAMDSSSGLASLRQPSGR